MHFDGWNTIEGRHLVFAYAGVILIQGGYVLWMAAQWRKLNATHRAYRKKTTKLA